MRNQFELMEQAFLVGYIQQQIPQDAIAPFVSVIPRAARWDPDRDPRDMERKGVVHGMPRIMFCAKDSPVVWIEILSKFSKPSEQESRVHRHLADLGHIVHVCHSAAEAIADMRAMGALDPVPRLPGVPVTD